MGFEKINKEKEKEKQQNIDAVKNIIKDHKTTKDIKIQQFLLAEYDIEVSISSIKRYKKQIKKDKVKETNQKMYQKKKEEEKLVKESEYPYDVFCPMCKTKSIITAQENRTVECWRCGLSYDRKNKVWIDMRTNRPFGEKINRVIGAAKFGFFEP